MGKRPRAAVHRSSILYFYKTEKRWRTGVVSQDTPQLPITGTPHALNHFAGDPGYNPNYCRDLIRKHEPKRQWNTRESSWEEFESCLKAPRNKPAGPHGVPPHLPHHLPPHMPEQVFHAALDIWRGNRIPATWLASKVLRIYKKKDSQDPLNYRPIYVSTAMYGILTRLHLKRITAALAAGLLDVQHGALGGRNTTTLTARSANDLHKIEGYLPLSRPRWAFPKHDWSCDTGPQNPCQAFPHEKKQNILFV